ncbi:TetR/AcrR family transcriptional regulator [Nocardiopsis alba]|uniref:TetR/AcrR family transcriptional regulator n=1 Tax=Nocardiopsis alba TaxID=53437 RepID=UPI0033C48CAC
MSGEAKTKDPAIVRRPGGRSARVRAAVYAAVLEELVETGYSRMTIESVAARADVHKTTVYRRWENIDALLTEAIRDSASTPVVPEDTGSLRGDLIAYASELVAVLSGRAGRIIAAALSSDAVSVEGVQEIKAMIFETRLPLSTRIVARGIERGEVPEETDAQEVIDFLTAPLYFRLIVSGGPLDERLARTTGAATAAAVEAGAFRGDDRQADPDRPR